MHIAHVWNFNSKQAKMPNPTAITARVSKSEHFLQAIISYATKPHTINRQLAGAEQVSIFMYPSPLTVEFDQIGEYVRTHPNVAVDSDYIPKLFDALSLRERLMPLDKTQLDNDSIADGSVIVLNKLLPKNLKCHENCAEVVIISARRVAFMPLNCQSIISKSFKLEIIVENGVDGSGELMATTLPDENRSADYETKLTNWIERVFLPKMQRRIESVADGQNEHVMDSLALVDLQEYNELYNRLKIKYGENMVKIWPERTDPAKFVYEDVAIAAYLLVLWQDERKRLGTNRLQSFVDLGCGNGLLVFILSSEGHRGYGIDLRKRGIWDMYPSTTELRTEAITPSNSSLYPDTDWIIGNHSDELSPWLPVIAARSSFNCRYFVLPCCAYEFDGRKYRRRSAKNSQYMDFLGYVQQISEVCGFHTQVDRLKIPSTKRICVIGAKRDYDCAEFAHQSARIQKFIDDESSAESTTEQWSADFRPRSSVEKVQNCTQIDKSIEQEIVTIVFGQLLAKKRFLDDFMPDWNVGGKITLADLIRSIPREKLKELKSECGGLQTLLKNNSQIFRVSGGAVEIRPPIKYCDKVEELRQRNAATFAEKQMRFKQTACWFLTNHPNGCPFDADDCSFKH